MRQGFQHATATKDAWQAGSKKNVLSFESAQLLLDPFGVQHEDRRAVQKNLQKR